MAGISTGQGENGKRAVDHEIPLVPFIDLFLCCIMFLLVTAVWNQLAAVDAELPADGAGRIDGPAPESVPLRLRVGTHGFDLIGNAGDETRVPWVGDEHDVGGLRERLAARRAILPGERTVVVSADDGVPYAELVQAMDALMAEGFDQVSVSHAL